MRRTGVRQLTGGELRVGFSQSAHGSFASGVTADENQFL